MRHRFALCVALLCFVTLLGCEKKPSGSGGDNTKNKGSSTTGGGTTPPSGASAKDARAFADTFLKELSEGKAKATSVSVAFKKLVGSPISEDEKKVGFSDPETESWLNKNFNETKFTINREPGVGDTFYYHGRAEKGKDVTAFVLWVTKEASGYKVAWLNRTARFLANPPATSGDDAALASETAQAFLDNLLGGEVKFALVLADDAFKTKLAPPTDDQKAKGLTYDPGFVEAKIKFLKGDAYEYKLADIKGDTVTGVLVGSNATEKAFTIKLVKKAGWTLVSDLEVK